MTAATNCRQKRQHNMARRKQKYRLACPILGKQKQNKHRSVLT